MKGKNRYLTFAAAFLLGTGALLTGCDSGERKESNLPAYVIIKEELDVRKTADKVNEIMNNAPDMGTVSGNGRRD